MSSNWIVVLCCPIFPVSEPDYSTCVSRITSYIINTVHLAITRYSYRALAGSAEFSHSAHSSLYCSVHVRTVIRPWQVLPASAAERAIYAETCRIVPAVDLARETWELEWNILGWCSIKLVIRMECFNKFSKKWLVLLSTTTIVFTVLS